MQLPVPTSVVNGLIRPRLLGFSHPSTSPPVLTFLGCPYFCVRMAEPSCCIRCVNLMSLCSLCHSLGIAVQTTEGRGGPSPGTRKKFYVSKTAHTLGGIRDLTSAVLGMSAGNLHFSSLSHCTWRRASNSDPLPVSDNPRSYEMESTDVEVLDLTTHATWSQQAKEYCPHSRPAGTCPSRPLKDGQARSCTLLGPLPGFGGWSRAELGGDAVWYPGMELP
jgi:hypothetical protein